MVGISCVSLCVVDTMATSYNEDSVAASRYNGTIPPVAATHGSTFSSRPDIDQHFVVAAIDFGTTYSGYAFAFTRDPDSIHMMRKWEGGDPGVTNMKVYVPLIMSVVNACSVVLPILCLLTMTRILLVFINHTRMF